MGLTELRVGWKEHQLKVKVIADKEAYKVREKASVRIAVETMDGKKPPKGTELAIAAVDRGLLELKPNLSWKLLERMMNPRGYEIKTATAQMQVVGRRHFGVKALPVGGGGGMDSARELFDTLLYWKARTRVDSDGVAEVTIPLNDSVTSFAIVGVANSEGGEFGTGETDIRTTQEMVLYSGIPPLMRQGDKFAAEFTLRNTSEEQKKIEVSLKTVPDLGHFPPQTYDLSPGKSAVAKWNVEIPTGVEKISYEALAQVSGTELKDKVRVSQKIVEVVPVRTYQATIEQLEESSTLPVRKPAGAIPERGGVDVIFQPSLLAGFSGIREYMSFYPYTCLEQNISKAVALRDHNEWEKIMVRLPDFMDGRGLLKFFPGMLYGYDILTAYVLSIADEAGWKIPKGYEVMMLAGLAGFVEGKHQQWYPYPAADWAIRKMASIEALSRYNKATPAMLTMLEIQPSLWPTSGVLDYWSALQRMGDVPSRDKKANEAWQILKSRLNFQGTVMSFSTEKADNLWWLMTTADVNAARMVLAALPNAENKSDMPRLVRGALSRLKKGHWDLTLANAWGVLAMEKFAKAFESVEVKGRSVAQLSGQTKTMDWATYTKETRGVAAENENTGLAAQKALQNVFSFPWPSTDSGAVKVSHHGAGKPWVIFQSKAALPLKEPLFTGYKITKNITPVEQKKKGVWSRGDLMRVHLDLDAQTDMTWVVVDDPVPAGVSILGTGLGRDSALGRVGEKRKGWVKPIFEERSFEAFRAYYEFVPKGQWTLEYTVRLNQSGAMNLPATRVEAMYSPEMFGEIPNAPQIVED